MNIFEIVSAIVLIIACVFIVVVVLMKDTKTQMSQTISGSSTDSFFQKNAGRTKDAMLNKATIGAVVVFFILALAVNVINVYFGEKAETSGTSSDTSISSTVDSDSTVESSSDAESQTSDTSSAETSSETSSTVSE